MYTRKKDKVVSLNPEYGIEVSTLTSLAEKIKDDNPDLYNIITIVTASLIGKDETTLLKYCNSYLEQKFSNEKIKDAINKMLKDYNDIDEDYQ